MNSNMAICCPFWYLHRNNPTNFPLCNNAWQTIMSNHFQYSQLNHQQPPTSHEQALLSQERPPPARPTSRMTRWLQAQAQMHEDRNWLAQQISEKQAHLQEHSDLAQSVETLLEQSQWHERYYGERAEAADRIQFLQQHYNAIGGRLSSRAQELRELLPTQPEQADFFAPNAGYKAKGRECAVGAPQYSGRDESFMVYNAFPSAPSYEPNEARNQEAPRTTPDNANASGNVESPKEYPLDPLDGTEEYWEQEDLNAYLKYVVAARFAARSEDRQAEAPFPFPESWSTKGKVEDEEELEEGADAFWIFHGQFQFLDIVDPHRFPPRDEDDDEFESAFSPPERCLTTEQFMLKPGYVHGEQDTPEAQMAYFQAVNPFLPTPRKENYETQQHTEPVPRLPSLEEQLREVSPKAVHETDATLTQLQELEDRRTDRRRCQHSRSLRRPPIGTPTRVVHIDGQGNVSLNNGGVSPDATSAFHAPLQQPWVRSSPCSADIRICVNSECLKCFPDIPVPYGDMVYLTWHQVPPGE
jgi:hypothetical protein